MKDTKEYRVVGKYAPVVIYKCLVDGCTEMRRSKPSIEGHIIEAHLGGSSEGADTKTREAGKTA